jgi:CRISPR/Cas system-associated endonuclease/helicase Cas3
MIVIIVPDTDQIADQNYLRTQQYRNADKLQARIRLHRLFGTNRYPWQRGAFDQLRLEPGQTVAIMLPTGRGVGFLFTRLAPNVTLVVGALPLLKTL